MKSIAARSFASSSSLISCLIACSPVTAGRFSSLLGPSRGCGSSGTVGQAQGGDFDGPDGYDSVLLLKSIPDSSFASSLCLDCWLTASSALSEGRFLSVLGPARGCGSLRLSRNGLLLLGGSESEEDSGTWPFYQTYPS